MSKKITIDITDDDKKILTELKRTGFGRTQSDVISKLLRDKASGKDLNDTKLSLTEFDLSDQEKTEVEEALSNSGSELDLVAKDGLLQRSRYLNSIAEKQAKFETMSEEEMQKATFKGAANFRIEQAIQTIINHNDAQAEKSCKVCLTKGMVFKLTGSNRQTINKYFDDHKVMISDHNIKHGLTDADNRKGKGFSFEELLGIE